MDSLNDLMNSSSSSNLRTGCFLPGDDSLKKVDLRGLNLDSLNDSPKSFLSGVEKVTFLLDLNPVAVPPLTGLL